MSSPLTSLSRPLLLAVTGAATLGLVACSSSGGGSVAKPGTSASASASASATPSAAAPSGAATASIGGTGTTGTSSGTSTGTGTGAGTTGPTLSVQVTTQPKCQSGTNLSMQPGVQPVIAWSSTGATNVRLAIDGPGLYGTFGPSGSDELPFGGCSGPDGSTVTHTYTFTTIPGGVTRTVTLTATAHTITDVGSGQSSPSASASP